MDPRTISPNRRGFLAGIGGIGAAGINIGSNSGQSWEEHPDISPTSGRLEMIVRFEPAERAGKATLQKHARQTQRPFEEFAAKQSGINIERQFWAANAALVTVDPGVFSRATLEAVETVTGVHPNHAVGVHSTTEESETMATEAGPNQLADGDVTYPLTEIDVPEAWDEYDTKGGGVDVAVIDSGIDTTDHSELAASLDRGGWAEFDERGTRVDSEPNAQTDFPLGGHGTAVSGIIAGGTTADGDQYGIAPAVNLYKAKFVTKPPEGVRTLSVFASIEWAIEQDVDILSMSIGLPQYNQAYVEPIQNAIESGILVITGTGNSGQYTSISPGNIPGVLSVGATDAESELYEDSGGEHIDTEQYWGETAGDEWPQEYIVPDVTAPGVDVPTPVLDGQFELNTGGSFATPCVAGVAALTIAATGADNDTVREAIIETARHPGADDEFDIDPGHDDRYGRGIVSALAAISRIKATETITGTVTSGNGNPLDTVTVTSETGLRTETDTDGKYELTLPSGTQSIDATAPGFDTTTMRVNPAEDDNLDFQVNPSGGLDVKMTDRMSTWVDEREEPTAAFNIANAESVVITVDSVFPEPKDFELSVGGTSAAIGEPVSIDPDQAELTIGVGFDSGIDIAQFQLSYEFRGAGESIAGEGNRVHSHSDPWVVNPGEPPNLGGAIGLVAPGTTIEVADGREEIRGRPNGDEGLVIRKPVEIRAAEGASPTLQLSDGAGEKQSLVLVNANDATISGLEIDAEGAETGIQVAREGALSKPHPHPSGVTLQNLVIHGAETAVHAGHAPALRITNNELSAKTTAITVGRQIEFQDSTTPTGRAKTILRENFITDVETGINVDGQVSAIERNTLSNIGDTGIHVGTPSFLSRHWGVDIGPIRANNISDGNRGIVVSGVMTLPIEQNTLTNITETGLYIDGVVVAPIRTNSIDGAQKGIGRSADAEIAEITDNEFLNVTESVGEVESLDGSDSSVSIPGFGIGSALVSLIGAGYLLQRGLSDNETKSE